MGRGTMRSMVEGPYRVRTAPPPPFGWSPSPSPAATGRTRQGPLLEPPRRRRQHRRPRRRHLANLERALRDAAAAEAEGAVDPGEAAGVLQRALGEGPADPPILRDPNREQHG